MRTPTRDHHGQPMGTRARHPDCILVGDTITWTHAGHTWHGETSGRESQPYVEIWIVGTVRVYRRHIVSHQPRAWAARVTAAEVGA